MEKKAIIKPQAFAGMIVKEITFLDNADNIPDKTIDFSTNKDGSVVGWKDPDCNILFVAQHVEIRSLQMKIALICLVFAEERFVLMDCRIWTHPM